MFVVIFAGLGNIFTKCLQNNVCREKIEQHCIPPEPDGNYKMVTWILLMGLIILNCSITLRAGTGHKISNKIFIEGGPSQVKAIY